MSEYTSTKEGFQRAMEWSLTGPASEAKDYVDGTTTKSFYHIMNNNRTEGDAYLKVIEEWRAKVGDYKPKVEEFLRDGDQLAARMIGTIKVEGIDTFFESFMFGKVEKESGKLEWLIERSVWGAVGKEPEHGTQ
ncbi:hypothetical protein BDV96DRAFT_567735 [Lophiotrema nucula]|uniref:SnoaL-like domain-containing protein n=1 Tax=Lophiotrema nucula TaxID=690887 RepID=A0A6A5ZKF9_9PLEO|nr:hypothetical protein BDV96DRAFT_567735 [Lophiotrema nucula]